MQEHAHTHILPTSVSMQSALGINPIWMEWNGIRCMYVQFNAGMALNPTRTKSSRKSVSIFLSICFCSIVWSLDVDVSASVSVFFHYKCNSLRQIAIRLMQRLSSLNELYTSNIFDFLNLLNMKSLCKLLSNFGIFIAKWNEWNNMSENSTSRDESVVVSIIASIFRPCIHSRISYAHHRCVRVCEFELRLSIEMHVCTMMETETAAKCIFLHCELFCYSRCVCSYNCTS